jgi:hypothetical protein
MPATRELLLSEIVELEKQINELILEGKDPIHLKQRLLAAKTAFAEKSSSINEGTNILKG